MGTNRRSFGAIRKLPSGRHQATYIGPDGQRHTAPATFPIKSQAESWLAAEERLVGDLTWTRPASRNPYDTGGDAPLTLDDYSTANLEGRATRSRKPIRANTLASYRQIYRLSIKPHLGALRLGEITPTRVRRWHSTLPEGTPTQNGHAYDLLRSLMSDAVAEGLIDANPVQIRGAGRPAPKRQGEALSMSQLAEYLAAADDRYRLPLGIAAWCSLRSSEVRALRRRDADDDGTRIWISQAVTRHTAETEDRGRFTDGFRFDDPKTTAGRRSIALPPAMATALAAWLIEWDKEHGTDRDQLLFTAIKGGPIHDSVLYKAHKRAAKLAGRPSLTLHDMRRAGATLAAQSGATIKGIMRRLGHTKPDVAMLYQVA